MKKANEHFTTTETFSRLLGLRPCDLIVTSSFWVDP